MKSKKIASPLSVATLCASAIITLYYTVYLILCLVGLDSRLMCIFALFVIGCVTLPIFFAERLKAVFGKAFRVLHIIFFVLLVLYIISVAAFWCYIGFDSSQTPERYIESADTTGEELIVMVFGCRTYDLTPSLTLQNRLDAAYKLLVGFPDAICIVSGGQGSNESIAEAASMKNYLMERGIDASRIIMEDRSHSTSENIRFTRELIKELSLEGKKIIGVSTSFHLPRIELLCRRYGLPMELCSSPSPSVGHHYVSMIREYLSYIKMLLFDRAVIITKVT